MLPLMLEPMKARLLRCQDLASAVARVLHDVVALKGAPFGDLQLHSRRDASLYLVAQTGFSRSFVDSFKRVRASESTVCARAFRTKKTVSVEDVETDEALRPYLKQVRAASVRSIQSTPLVGGNGRVIGVVSTHFAKRHEPTEIESRVVREYCAFAGEYLARLLGERDESADAEVVHVAL
jgi:GAF domain-containing protein